MRTPTAALDDDDWSREPDERGSGCFTLTSNEAPLSTRLRRQAVEVDASRAVPHELGATWASLLAGSTVIADWFYSPSRWFVLCATLPEAPSFEPVPPHVRLLFDTLFLGQSQKKAAFENDVCSSTISCRVRAALERLGASITPSHAPPVLALMARAGLGLATSCARRSVLEASGRTYDVVSVQRPELRLAPSLSPAEYHVLCRIVEGHTYAQIAAERRTSRRTVANQIAAVFRQLGVSGRAELVAHVLALAASDDV